jgi:fumarate reductase subunit C
VRWTFIANPVIMSMIRLAVVTIIVKLRHAVFYHKSGDQVMNMITVIRAKSRTLVLLMNAFVSRWALSRTS